MLHLPPTVSQFGLKKRCGYTKLCVLIIDIVLLSRKEPGREQVFSKSFLNEWMNEKALPPFSATGAYLVICLSSTWCHLLCLYHWAKRFWKDSILLWKAPRRKGDPCLETCHVPVSTHGSGGCLFKRYTFQGKVWSPPVVRNPAKIWARLDSELFLPLPALPIAWMRLQLDQ